MGLFSRLALWLSLVLDLINYKENILNQDWSIHFKKNFTKNYPHISPDIFDPRKVDTNFLEVNFEYFRLLIAMGDVNN